MDGVIIRGARPEDAAELLSIYQYYVKNTAVTFEYDVPSVEEFRARIEKTLERYPYLAAERNGVPVGYAYAGKFSARPAYDWSAELTIYIDADARGQGLGRRLYSALENELREMGITNMYACIACSGEDDEYLTGSSLDFHHHLGFVTAGVFRKCGYKFGRWYDMAWLEKIIGEHRENMPPVKWK